MKNKREIELGEKIEIVTDVGKPEEKIYFSMVQDIKDGGIIVINLPVASGEQAFLYDGQEVAVNYFRCHGQYYFLATVLDRYKSKGLYSFELRRSSEINRLQRRNYFRLEKNIPMEIDIHTDDGATSGTIRGYTSNICGGGVGVIIGQELTVGTDVKCMFELRGNDKIGKFYADGNIVRCEQLQCAEGRFEIGISFDNMPEQERDEIIKFIFDEQRRLRKRGLM